MKPHGILKALAIGAATLVTLSAGAGLAAPSSEPLTGVWRPEAPSGSMKTIDGRTPPLNAAGKAIYARRIAEKKAGKNQDGVEACLPPGSPRIMWQSTPMMVLDTPRKVTLVHEFQHIQRHIHLTDPMPVADDLNPAFGGTSVGRWEGDTLVVQTLGFNEKTQLDADGLPHSPQMKLTERIRLIDGGNRLEDRVTVDDSKFYSQPWTARVTFVRAPGVSLAEDICAEKLLKTKVRDYWAEHQRSLAAK